MPSSSPAAVLPPTGWKSPRGLLRLSVVVALATIVLKMLAWWLTGSVGLLSDALESFVNLAGAIFALAMVTIAQRPADDDHPYGHHKAEYFSAGFEGLLVVGASLAIIWVGVDRWMHPRALERLDWGLGLSLLSTVLNGALALVMLRSARAYRSMALEGDARHLLTDVWTSVGVVAGLALAHISGWQWLDAAVAVAVGLNILVQGCLLVWESSQGLMDSALDAEARNTIDATLQQCAEQLQREEGVHIAFDSISTRRAGERSFIDLHMHAPGQWTLAHAAQWRTRVERALMQAIPGSQARIEVLPDGMATAYEQAMLAQPSDAIKNE